MTYHDFKSCGGQISTYGTWINDIVCPWCTLSWHTNPLLQMQFTINTRYITHCTSNTEAGPCEKNISRINRRTYQLRNSEVHAIFFLSTKHTEKCSPFTLRSTHQHLDKLIKRLSLCSKRMLGETKRFCKV